MTPATLTPPSDPGHLWPDDAGSEPPLDAGGPAPGVGRRRRRPLALLLVTSAVLGGASTAGVLAAAGLTGGGSTTTTTVLERAGGTAAGSGGLDAQAVYTSAAAGVVDITVHSRAAAAPATPFGGAQPQSQTTASGTGFVVDGEGHIVTAEHVVDGATSIRSSSRTAPAARPRCSGRTTPPTSPSSGSTRPG